MDPARVCRATEARESQSILRVDGRLRFESPNGWFESTTTTTMRGSNKQIPRSNESSSVDDSDGTYSPRPAPVGDDGRDAVWWGGPSCTAGPMQGWVLGKVARVSRAAGFSHGHWVRLWAWGRPPRSWTPHRTARGLRVGGCCSARPGFSFSGTTVTGRGPGGRARGPSRP
jgi:hypothetical protein